MSPRERVNDALLDIAIHPTGERDACKAARVRQHDIDDPTVFRIPEVGRDQKFLGVRLNHLSDSGHIPVSH